MNLRLLLQLAAALSLTFASILALAAVRADSPEIEVEEPFSRATVGAGQAGVVYLRLHNRGTRADRLLGASTPLAQRCDLHAVEHVGTVARMRRVEAVEVPSGETVALEPGGLHIMLSGLAAPLSEGERFPLTLQFETAGAMTVEVPVRSIAAGASTGPHGEASH